MRALDVLAGPATRARGAGGLTTALWDPTTVRLQKAEKALKVAVSERNVQKGDLTVRSACEAPSALHARGRDQLGWSFLRGIRIASLSWSAMCARHTLSWSSLGTKVCGDNSRSTT